MKNGTLVLGFFLISACSTTSGWWGMEHDPESLMEGEGPKVRWPQSPNCNKPPGRSQRGRFEFTQESH